MKSEIFKISNLSKKFNTHLVLSNITLSITEKSITGLLGPNGAGKTTLLRIMTGILSPDYGNILFNNILNPNLERRNIGYLPEERGLYKKMKVKEMLIFFGQLKNLSKKEAGERADYWLKKFEITASGKRKTEELSKGIQQKIQLIIAFIHEPPIIILDEPFSGLDPVNAELVKTIIWELNSRGTTFILSTHRMESVEKLCTEVVFLNKGTIILSGDIQDIRNRFRKKTVQIEGKGEIPNEGKAFLLKSMKVENELIKATVRLKENESINTLIAELLPSFSFLSLEQEVPAMETIFLKTVGADA